MNTRPSAILFLAAAFSTAALTPLVAANYDRHDQHPKAIFKPAPVYAFDLRKAEIEGAVLVSFNITAQGDVTDPVVVESTDRVFEETTLNAVKRWKFTPAVIAGQAAEVSAMQLVTYMAEGRNPATHSLMLVKNMKPRQGVMNTTSTSVCYCGSNEVYNNCHGSEAFRQLASEGKLITGKYSTR